MNHLTHPLSSADIIIFSPEIRKFYYIKKCKYKLHFDIFLIVLTFFHSLKMILINMVIILMMSTKKATLALLEIKVFWNKGYDVIICVYGVNDKILSSDSNYVVDLVMWPTIGNSSISMREVDTTSILQGFDQKNPSFWGVVLVQVQ